MKKLILILAICVAFGCKKKNETVEDDITKYSWPLTSATISPALVVNGRAETNFKIMSGPSGCLNNNYTLSFSNDGSFAFTSNGPLCDMISYQNAKWSKKGNEITLNDGQPHNVILSGNIITDKYSFNQDNINYTVTYIYTARSK
ncbi:hypothetical protein EZ449_02145 [Pedobacter frigidisoli]|uniref:Lipocalin-like domain-containing protein n=1 Tax=Pedobacter frigidisoli TaxID=2530455 RepID=A0A4R0P9P3_9SPHI|nr:hypothetical protein [Pedobacter frigidisoli]TCD12867.1 hypothetical protein EZ449_02145 [Pedobacter frigidisoli]